MNRLAISIGVLGVGLAAYAPVALYANQDGRAPQAEALSSPSEPEANVTVAVWSPPAASSVAPVAAKPLAEAKAAEPEAIYSESLPAGYNGEYDMPVWAVVSRGARLHTGPDVSSSTVGFYAPGAKLHVTGYRQGWFKVAEPETGRTGYIYARYYLEALRGPDAMPVVAKAEAPVRTALAEPALDAGPKPAVRHSSHMNPSLLAPPDRIAQPSVARPARASRAAYRPDGVASLLDRAMRR